MGKRVRPTGSESSQPKAAARGKEFKPPGRGGGLQANVFATLFLIHLTSPPIQRPPDYRMRDGGCRAKPTLPLYDPRAIDDLWQYVAIDLALAVEDHVTRALINT